VVGQLLEVYPFMTERTGRLEKRIALTVPVQLEGLVLSSTVETSKTENVSSLGVRMVSSQSWPTEQRLRLTLLQSGQRRLVKVIYCHTSSSGKFAVGLQFLGPPMDWAAKFGSD
jgi:hypothetical protein